MSESRTTLICASTHNKHKSHPPQIANMLSILTTFLFLLSAFVGSGSAIPASLDTTAVASTTTLDARSDSGSGDYYPGYNNTCVSWHIEPSPDNTELNLVAKCKGGDPAVDAGMVCSQIDLNRCYYHSEGWLLPLDNSAASTGDEEPRQWYPTPCHQFQLMPARGPHDDVPWDPIGHDMLFLCNVPHLAPMPEGYTGMYVNLASERRYSLFILLLTIFDLTLHKSPFPHPL
ncbi:hypothetical protein Micbo1qcDRAFT_222402 [Microdochium bolleyi]|uniref:Cyanovirin-N domain-containing protein n=1 Tax=Microdochium bolleyi TaxID=196109 RepID=A0A136J6J8_9PEZI|nr:hypothetical protein Micbo1qcDRAFT_222402 [Microdochium bolleyi]